MTETQDTHGIYVWRYPNWFIAIVVALTTGPHIAVLAYLTYVAWDFAAVEQSLLTIALVVAACGEAWLLSKITIRIAPEEVRFLWPFVLRSDEVAGYEFVRYWGLDCVHIRRKKGFTYKQLLSMPGGARSFDANSLRGLNGPPRTHSCGRKGGYRSCGFYTWKRRRLCGRRGSEEAQLQLSDRWEPAMDAVLRPLRKPVHRLSRAEGRAAAA